MIIISETQPETLPGFDARLLADRNLARVYLQRGRQFIIRPPGTDAERAEINKIAAESGQFMEV